MTSRAPSGTPRLRIRSVADREKPAVSIHRANGWTTYARMWQVMCGAGGARTHDRQIMRKPARLPLMLAERLRCLSVLVSRDLAGRGGTGQGGAGWDGCSHSVPIRRQGHGSLACAY